MASKKKYKLLEVTIDHNNEFIHPQWKDDEYAKRLVVLYLLLADLVNEYEDTTILKVHADLQKMHTDMQDSGSVDEDGLIL